MDGTMTPILIAATLVIQPHLSICELSTEEARKQHHHTSSFDDKSLYHTCREPNATRLVDEDRSSTRDRWWTRLAWG
jgi:hypothetical protein